DDHPVRWLRPGGIRLADGTQLAVASYPGCQQPSEFAGFARYGYSKSHHRFVWGVRLVLLTDERGLPLGYTIVAANEKEYEPLADLVTGTPSEIVIADSLGPRLPRTARRCRRPAAHPRQDTHRRQPRPRTSARLNPTRDRKRLREPQGPDAARTPPRENARRTGRADRPTHPRPHDRNAAQHPRRPPRTRPP